MGRPPHVDDLEEYWLWVETALQATGGYFEHGPYFRVQLLIDDFTNETIGLSIPQHRMFFHDGTFLEFDLVIDEDFLPTEYSFHFQHIDGPMIWRKDLHPGHEEELGTEAHIHKNPDDENDRAPFIIVEIDEVVDQIGRYQDTGWTP